MSHQIVLAFFHVLSDPILIDLDRFMKILFFISTVSKIPKGHCIQCLQSIFPQIFENLKMKEYARIFFLGECVEAIK